MRRHQQTRQLETRITQLETDLVAVAQAVGAARTRIQLTEQRGAYRDLTGKPHADKHQ